jgi:hypothetical protein
MIVDIVALIFGVILTVRKLDVTRRSAEQFPNVSAEDFARWQSLESSAYRLGSFACFLKIAVDYAFLFLAQRASSSWTLVRIVGGTIFSAWVIALMLVVLRGARARRLRDELGIVFREEKP